MAENKARTGRSALAEVQESEAEKWLEKHLMEPEIAAQRHLGALCYGRPGVGKTTFCATAPKPMLLANAEQSGGVIPISKAEGIKVVQLENYRDILLVLKFLCSGKHKFVSFALDGLTELQKMGMDEILRESKKDLPAIQDWQRSGEDIRFLIRSLVKLPMNLIVTATAKEEKDESEGLVKTRIDVPGKLAGALPADFDCVGFLGVKTSTEEPGRVERHLVVEPHPKLDAKLRIPPGREHLFERFERPDFSSLHHRMFAELDESGQPKGAAGAAKSADEKPKKDSPKML